MIEGNQCNVNNQLPVLADNGILNQIIIDTQHPTMNQPLGMTLGQAAINSPITMTSILETSMNQLAGYNKGFQLSHVTFDSQDNSSDQIGRFNSASMTILIILKIVFSHYFLSYRRFNFSHTKTNA